MSRIKVFYEHVLIVLKRDELVNIAILKGLEISRSRLYFYKHNDLDDLEKVLQLIDLEDLEVNFAVVNLTHEYRKKEH